MTIISLISHKYKMNKKISNIVYNLILIIFLLVLCYNFPYTGDDWAWGSSIGLSRLSTFFSNYNGRYLGNLTVILLTRSNLLKTIVMTIVWSGIIYNIYYISDKKRYSIYLSIALIILIPSSIFRQSIAWTSGFTNYVPPILFTLTYINIIKYNHSLTLKKKSNLILSFSTFILGFLSTLFVEHVTIYCFALSIFTMIFFKCKHKKIPLFSISYFLSTALGTYIIFFASGSISSNDYRKIPTTAVGYIDKFIDNYFTVISKELIQNNFSLNLLITILLFAIVIKHLKNDRKTLRYTWVLIISQLYNMGYLIYSFLTIMHPSWRPLLSYTKYFNGIATALFAISTIFLMFSTIKASNILLNLLFNCISIIILTGPLFFILPIGSRCFLVTYIFFILIIIDLLKYVLSLYPLNYKIKNIIYLYSKIHVLIIFLFILNIFIYINHTHQKRLDYVNCQKEQKRSIIKIISLPYDEYLWTSNPCDNGVWEERFKLFYKIDKNADLRLISIDEANKEYKSN